MASRVLFLLVVLVSSAFAQTNGELTIHWVRVRINFANGGCDGPTHVTLVGHNGPTAQASTDSDCVVEFSNVPEGTYRVNVSGQNIADVDAGTVTMTAGGVSDFEVRVNRDRSSTHAGAFTAVSDLAVPAAARKDFDRANKLIEHQNLDKAKDLLNHAITVYPAYASAYNSLGVIYAREGDSTHEREVLQKAISINDHFAPAYVNLGRMNIRTSNFPAAEAALTKASALDPTDPMTLVLLSFAEINEGHLDDVIAVSRKAHTLGGSHAFVHQAAARAYEHKGDASDAITELETFLKEEPNGARSDAAHKELEAVKAIPR